MSVDHDPDTPDEVEKSAEEEAKAAAEAGVNVDSISCFELFRFATLCEKIMAILGIIFVAMNGAGTPLFAIVLGEFIHAGFQVSLK